MAVFRSPVMVGRDRELDRLRQVLAAVEHAEPAFVVIEGEPGVGKTRLAVELVAELDSALLLSGHGLAPLSGELPFGVLVEVLRDLVRTLGADRVRSELDDESLMLERLVPALAESDSGGAPLDRVALFGATAALLQRLAEDRLVVVFVDDLQWADAESMEILEYVGRVARACRLLVLTTVRTGNVEGDRFAEQLAGLHRLPGREIVAIGRLDDGEVAEQVRQLIGPDVDAATVSRVFELSDGIPFFVEELAASGVMEGQRLPTSIQRLALARLPELTEDARDVLDAVAIDETHSQHQLLLRATEMDRRRIEAATAQAIEVGVLEMTDSRRGYRFRHVLLRETLDEVMHPSRRIHWHQRWARTLSNVRGSLDATEGAIVVAQHWDAAGDREKTLTSAIAAAQAAGRLAAPKQEAEFWQRAFALWPAEREYVDDVSQGEVAVRLTRARDWALQTGELLGWCRTVLRSGVDDPALELWLQINEQMHAGLAGDPGVGFVTADDVGDLIGRLASMGCSWPVMEAIDGLWHEFPECQAQLFDDVDRLLDQMARQLGDDHMIGGVIGHRAWFALQSGRADEALQHAMDELEYTRSRSPMQRRGAEAHVVNMLLAQGRAAQAVDIGTAAMRTFSEPDAAPLLWRWLALELGRGLLALGRIEQASDLVEHAGQMAAPELPGPPMHALLKMRIDCRRGDLPAATRLLDELAAKARPNVPRESPWSWHWVGYADIAFASGDLALLEELRPLLGQWWLVRASEWTWELLLNAVRAGLCPLSGHPGPVKDALEFAEACDRLHRHGELGRAWSLEVAALRSRTIGTDTSIEWVAAADAWQHIGYRFDEAVCRLRLGEALLRDGNRQPAAEQLNDALGLARALDARPLRDAIGHTARLARLRLVGDTSTRRAGTLTERETEVLVLVAQGRTNEEIAKKLVISPKTASVHVSRIITKLGAANRTEASAIARNLGLIN